MESVSVPDIVEALQRALADGDVRRGLTLLEIAAVSSVTAVAKLAALGFW